MRKIQLFVLSVVVVLFTACHGNIWDAIDDLDARVARLEELCKEMNTNITSLQTIVSVIQENDVITGITPIEKGGKVVGYTISFDKHEPITIYNGEDGKDGANGVDGKDGYTPILGVAKDTDGVYYWTLDGEWLLDAEGNKLRVTGRDGKDGIDGEDGKDGADGKDGQDGQDGKDGVDGADGKDGVTPQLKIEEGYWYISYDNGATWTELGKAVGEDGKDGQDGKPGADGKDGKDGDSMFTKVTYDEKNVYLTLTNGTVLTIPLGEGVWEALEGLEERIAKLEALCKEMNTNISALQTIVSALQSNDYITAVIPVEKDGKVIGYTIAFGKHDPITIYNGEDGKDGANGTNGIDGKDGYTPILGVVKDTDGVYYWTLDGEWLLDAEGNKLRVTGRDGKDGVDGEDGKDGENGKDGVDGEDGQDGTNGTNGVDGKDGVTPQLKIENGYWYISYDKGETWTELGKAVGEDGKDGIDGEDGVDGEDGKDGQDGKPGADGKDGDSMFTSVTYDDNNVYFTLTDGSVLIVPRGNSTSDFDQTVIDNLVNSLELDKDTVFLTIGEKTIITATTAPFPNSKVIWSSSDETIAKVSNGEVEAIGKGDAIVFAQAGALKQGCIILVGSSNSETMGTENGYTYVDLGLSVKWATCNVGAATPEEYGDYFAWGEVEPKTTYNWSTYKYCKGTNKTITKYCNNSTLGNDGFTDDKIILDLEDDAAYVNWGGSWRMPTEAEQQALVNNCTWTWTTQNGVNGYKVTGPNGNSIFLPASGYIDGTSPSYVGERGDFWASSLSLNSPRNAYNVFFRSNVVNVTYSYRNYGRSVRPVCP